MKYLALVLLALCIAAPAQAEKIKYFQDPVYKPLNGQDAHPMNDLLVLAEGGDVRAQFILGDLYAKGKGGLAKNPKKGAEWFEQAARQGYAPSFIRLAALAKRGNDAVGAYQWYTLASDLGRGKDRAYAQDARAALADEEKMTKEQIAQAKKQVSEWRNASSKAAREAREKKKLDERREAVRVKEEAKEIKETEKKETKHVED